ncbi:hypothetical protein AFLA_011126 [Aspergillus flavus NRRL3357]|nr:hypothetical protein AFLA_011126 [Aspergillus flavus NRRL3357]
MPPVSCPRDRWFVASWNTTSVYTFQTTYTLCRRRFDEGERRSNGLRRPLILLGGQPITEQPTTCDHHPQICHWNWSFGPLILVYEPEKSLRTRKRRKQNKDKESHLMFIPSRHSSLLVLTAVGVAPSGVP